MLFKFLVEATKLQCQNSSKIVISDSAEFHIAEFVFNDVWNDYAKEATFTNTYTNKTVVMQLDNMNRCYIPQEALELKKDVKASLVVAIHGIGISNPNSIIWTKMVNPLTMFKSDKRDYDTPIEPTPSMYNQIMAKIATKGDEITAEEDKLYLKSEGNIISEVKLEISGDGVDYEKLTNLPLINNNELVGNKTNEELGIPTKTSELTNDKQFIDETQTEKIDIDFSGFFD